MNSRGAALILAVMAIALLAALGLSLAVLTGMEMRVAANYALAHEAMSAAETALELAVRDVLGMADWSGVLDGSTRSWFVDGPPGGPRTLSDGAILDLATVTANLGNPEWRPFAYGPLSRFENLPSNAYVVVWTAPELAGQEGVMVMRAEAFGPSGARRAVQASVSRRGVLAWWEVR